MRLAGEKPTHQSLRTINARSGSVTTTPSFREPFKSLRCLIPADGFYEWVSNGKSKQPYCFEVGDEEVFVSCLANKTDAAAVPIFLALDELLCVPGITCLRKIIGQDRKEDSN